MASQRKPGKTKCLSIFRDTIHASVSFFLRDTRLASRQVAGNKAIKFHDQEAFVMSSLRFDWLIQSKSKARGLPVTPSEGEAPAELPSRCVDLLRGSAAASPSRKTTAGFRWLGVCCLVGVLIASHLKAQEVDPEEAKEKSVADRFVTVLEKNPRRGTALDKVYGFHVERGTLDGLIKNYRDKSQTAKGADAGTAWMIVGLLESLRGQDAVAVDAFEHAEQLVKDNYLASYYLGQSLVLIGQPDKAAEALERSIQRKPAQADLLDIFQALGRVYQRAQKTDKALEVWNRLEKQFPNDARVQEQIATTLLEENEFAAALPRYQSLVKITKDKYRQSLFQMESSEIKVRLGKSDEAIAEFEKLLGQLNPDNWLYREVRRRIEAVYLRTDDQSGLITYYETWIKKNAEDLEAVSRLSRLLAGMGRGPEAQAWLEKGLKLAPKKKELRNALIGQLMYEQKYPEAIAQYEQLDKYEPNNPDTLRDWGRVILKDTTRDEATRKKDAAAVWRRLTTAKPKDPLIASQVGELFRQAEMTDEALEQYQKAISLAPDQAQYREYLGEYFHTLKRKDEALTTWRAIAEGKLKTAPNVARLAEVLASFGYLAEAVETNAEACKLDPKDFALQVKQADLLAQADQHDQALTQLTIVKKLAANDEEREAWLNRELRELQAVNKLKERIAELEQDKDSRDADHWFWLGRAYEAERQMKEASQAVTKASTLAPQSVPILMASARIYEAQNNLLAAVDINTRLAAIDRRYRTEYLKQVATLEQKLGRRDKAIQAGRDLIAAAPGNPETYEFFSQLCFQLGESEEGLGALRRSVRVNPTEPKGLLLLASALSEQFRTSEAIELYWRAFDKASNLEDRLGVVPKLTELYLQTNQFDRLLERLERQRREPNQQREMTICLAQAYQSAGDDGNARQELEKLLTEETRDIQLLNQLVKLCESDGDLEAAVKFQQQLMKSAPGKEATMRLAQLMMKLGENDEATALMSRITIEEKDPETVLKSLDSMLNQENYAQALTIAEKLSRDQPKNWELIYREGVALAKSKDKAAEAKSRFEAILALKLNDDEMTLSAKNRLKKAQGRTRSPVVQTTEMNPMLMRTQSTWEIRQAIGLDNQNYYGNGQQPLWTPHDYGAARMACFGWLNLLARNEGKEDEFLKEHRERGEKAEDPRGLHDWYYFASLTNNQKATYEILKKLSLRPDADVTTKTMYLASLSSRGFAPGQVDADGDPVLMTEETAEADEDDEETQQRMPKLAALDPDEMNHVMECYKSIDDTTAMMQFGQMFLQVVAAELKRAGRKDEADKMLNDVISAAKEPAQIASLLPEVVQKNDDATAIILLDRLAEFKDDEGANQTQNPNGVFNYAQYVSTAEYQSQILAQLMSKRAKKKAIGDVLELWDRYLTTAVARYEKQKSIPAATKKRNQQQFLYQQQGYVYVWQGNNQQYVNLAFPAANEIYNQSTIQMLYQAFSIYKDADSSRDLVDHFQKKLSDPNTSETQKIFWQFGLGYLHWWLDEKDEALAVLAPATERLNDNVDMTFELARLYEQRGEHERALAIVDSLTATDQQAMQKREVSALRMAVNSGNIDRARTAAERLFGLRLDSNLQIQLAQQMHQLGMHDQAEAVLSRAGRQAGNKTDVLSNLMQQYQSQGKNEVATQIAHQLLRRSSGSSTTMNALARRSGNNPNGDSSLRQQALTVLKRSGKLPEMIKKVEGQLKSAPKSQRLIETLIEYYTANGDTKKVEEMTAKIAETKQDDPQFRFNLGQQLMNQGKHKEAVEHFKVVLKKEPKLARNGFYQIINSFQQADKLNDLTSVIDEMDFKMFRQNPWELTNMISNLSYQEKSKTQAVALFKRAWKDLPDQRQQLLSNLNNDIFWQMPEIYDYARQGIVPTETSILQNAGWPGFGQIQSWGGDGKITTLMNRFLTIAASNKKFDELTKEIEATQKKVRKWDGGAALLALIDLRRGKVDEAKVVLEKLLPTFKGMQQGQYTRWEIAQELMPHEKCIDLAIQYFEAATKDPDAMTQNMFQYTPGKQLVTLYKQQGRKNDARRVMLDASKAHATRHRGNEDYEAYQRINNSTSLGNEMKAIGFPIDALRVYQEQLARSEDFVSAARVFGGGTNGTQQITRMRKQLETGFQSVLKELKPELLPELLTGDDPTKDRPSHLDLLLLLESRDLDKTTMSSALSSLVAGIASNPEMVAKTKSALSDIRAKSPGDFAVLILVAQLSATLKDTDNQSAVVKQLVELVDATPLEPRPQKGGFTTKQREVAKPQIALWLVGRDCLKHESLRAAGVKLGERALEASRRQTDHGYALAILREWGQLAIQAGDKEAAEQRWTQMLEVVIPKPVEKKKEDGAKTGSIDDSLRNHLRRGLSRWEMMLAPALMGQATIIAVPLGAPAPPAAAGGTKGNVITLAQFEQAAQIAKLAAENGLNDLSIKAMTMALQAGPPIEAMQAIDPNQPFARPVNPNQNEESQLTMKIEERLTAVERLWRQKGFSDEVVYNLLKSAVLPERRPYEVFLYPRPLNLNPNQPPQSVGSLLVKAAVKGNKVDEVKQLLEPKMKQPLDELSARVLLAQLALATRDNALAAQQIELLSKRLQQDSLQNSSELACHVAIPALSQTELRPTAMALLERAVDHFTQNATQGRGGAQEEPLRSFRFALARLHFQNKNVEGGKKQLEEYLNYLTPAYARYGGNYGQYRRRVELMKIAAEYARAGLRTESLECLGRYADLPIINNYGQEGPSRAGTTILSGLATIPSAERYELLKAWSLPTAERKSIRVIGNLIAGDTAPSSFDALRGDVPRGPRVPELASTADLLVAAAAETRQLDELRDALMPHAEQDVEHAKFLLLMTEIARGDGAGQLPVLRKYVDARKKVAGGGAGDEDGDDNGNNQSRAQINDLLLAHAAIGDKNLRPIGRELALQFVNQAGRFQEQLLMAIGRREYYTPTVGPKAAERMNHESWNTDLKHWTAGAVVNARTEAAGALPMWWIGHDGQIAHLCGPDASHLYFKYPLTGEFEVTCDAWLGPWGECDLGYGGIVYHGLNLGSDTQIMSVGNRVDSVHKPDPPEVQNRYNQIRLEIRPDKVRYFVNGYFIHEEPKPSSASPWLFVHCDKVWLSALQNLKITGRPAIPREVGLVKGDNLLGWVTEFYGEQQPNRDPDRVIDHDSGQPTEAPEFDWWAKEGVIHGRQQSLSGLSKPTVQQSRLHYDRPIQDGERIKYEFWYESGVETSDVAPAFDRLAFLFNAEGVKLHWMTDGSSPEDAYSGLTADNVVVEQSIQRGKVNLKDRDWNSVEVSLKESVVTLSLNDAVVAVRKLESENSRQFGFYHDKNATAVQIRNIVLTGDWPETLSSEITSNLLAPAHERTPQERRNFGRTIDEKFHTSGLEDLLLQTRAMPPEAQYEALKHWVLPNDDHANYRLFADFTSDNAIPTQNRLTGRLDSNRDNDVPSFRRQKIGGELIAPAFDLIDVAKKLNRLEELTQLVEQAADDKTPLAARSKLAMQILINTAKGDFAKSNEGIGQLLPLCKAIPENARMVKRWPEVLVGSDATRHPQLRPSALTLLTQIVDHQHKRGLGEMWEGRTTGLRDHCKRLIDTNQYPAAGGSSPKGQWATSSIEWADAHARGPVSRWHFRENEITHVAGYSHDYLYYQSPLRGSFTVEAELATDGWRETRLMYHAHWVGAQYTREVVDLGDLTSSWQSPKIEPKVEFGDWCLMKLAVEPNKATYYINDRKVHEQTLPDQPDPWLALMTWGNLSGGARMIRIKGQPEIPEQLHLSARNDLIGWTASLYHDPMNNRQLNDNENENPNAWIKNNDEIVGQQFVKTPGRKRASLLRYHRPLVDDSVVDYDFFYAANETHVHPALGRMAFLLEPDGVKLHWLTDAQWERSGVTPDNIESNPEHRRGPAALPLKKDDWNHLQLTTKGDTVLLKLNDTDIYEGPIALTNQRQLGLFHYVEETAVRVKNVVYRGAWPRTLPSLKEQEFSNMGPMYYDLADAELKTDFDWNFQGANPVMLKPWGVVKPNLMEPAKDGLKIVRGENATSEAIPCGYTWNSDIQGDFDVTLSYRDLQSKTEQPDWQIPRVELHLYIGGGYEDSTHMLHTGQRQRINGTSNVYTGHGIRVSDKLESKYSERETPEKSGKIRIVRKGTTAYYLYSKSEADEWILLNSGPVSAAPLKGGNFCLRAEMPTSSASVVFTRLTIRSNKHAQTTQNLKPYEFAEGELTTKLAFNFQGPKPEFLNVFGDVKPNRMEPASKGLKLVRGENGTEDGGFCGFIWNTDVKSDVEVTIGYRDFVSKTEQKDWQAPRIEAQFDIGGGWNDPENTNVVLGGFRRQADKSMLFVANRIRVKDEFDWKHGFRDATEASGRLRFVRKGETAYYLHSKPDAKEWDLIYEGPIGNAPLKGGNFGLRSEIPASTGELVLTEFIMKTK
jgi:tetratricopeptide (TPR) repeat protein